MSDVEAIVAFLTACHDEDERIAREAMQPPFDPLQRDLQESSGRWEITRNGREIEGDYLSIYDEGGHDEQDAAHIVRHDPASVLLRIDSQRAIVTAYREKMLEYDELQAGTQTYSVDEDARDVIEAQAWGEVEGLESAVQALAFGYRGRDGFDSSWFDHPWGPL